LHWIVVFLCKIAVLVNAAQRLPIPKRVSRT